MKTKEEELKEKAICINCEEYVDNLIPFNDKVLRMLSKINLELAGSVEYGVCKDCFKEELNLIRLENSLK